MQLGTLIASALLSPWAYEGEAIFCQQVEGQICLESEAFLSQQGSTHPGYVEIATIEEVKSLLAAPTLDEVLAKFEQFLREANSVGASA